MESNICKYFSCVVAKETGRNCADYESCQAFKFYEKYGTEPLGVGACCDAGIFSRLEEKLSEFEEQ